MSKSCGIVDSKSNIWMRVKGGKSYTPKDILVKKTLLSGRQSIVIHVEGEVNIRAVQHSESNQGR